jgi:4-hydroxythreonine-4-phosphate dehydrogenase
MLAHLTSTSQYLMMMAGTRLRVVLVTIHEPLGNVASLINQDNICNCIEMTILSLKKDFGISDPKIAVAGFNPHGGEHGLFGDEEERVIVPAVKKARLQGEVFGPMPPDTVFYSAAKGLYDAVIAMYHDQGLIPFKMLHFDDGVNVTLGLPIVRTSVDHGTAYDLAGKWKASEASLFSAVKMAEDIIFNRKSKAL